MLFEFLKVLPEGTLVDRHGITVVRVVCIEVNVGDVELIVSLISFNIDCLDLTLQARET